MAGFLTQLALKGLPILNEQWRGVSKFIRAIQQRVLFRNLTGFPFMQSNEFRCITKTLQK